MKKNLRILTGLLLVIMSVGSGHASTITLDDNLTDGTYITAGTSLHGVFNITPYLSQGQFNAPEIQSASYTFTFEDDLDRVFTHNTTTQYVRATSWWDGTEFKYRDSINHYEDDYEKVAAEVQGQLNYAHTAGYEKTDFISQSFDGTSNWGTIRCYTYYHENVKGYSGLMSITHELGVDQLQSLSEDGLLAFELSSVAGDMIYTGGSLTVELSDTSVPGAAHAPEPATMALFGSGLLAFAGILRREQ